MAKKSLHSICRWTFNAGKGGFVPADIRPQWAGARFGAPELMPAYHLFMALLRLVRDAAPRAAFDLHGIEIQIVEVILFVVAVVWIARHAIEDIWSAVTQLLERILGGRRRRRGNKGQAGNRGAEERRLM